MTEVVGAQPKQGAEAIQLDFPGTGVESQASPSFPKLVKSDRLLCADVGRLVESLAATAAKWAYVDIPGGDYESWVLGIGDFPDQPFMRRFRGAAFIALVILSSPLVSDRAPAVMGESPPRIWHTPTSKSTTATKNVKNGRQPLGPQSVT